VALASSRWNASIPFYWVPTLAQHSLAFWLHCRRILEGLKSKEKIRKIQKQLNIFEDNANGPLPNCVQSVEHFVFLSNPIYAAYSNHVGNAVWRHDGKGKII
jgi:hypothetical protein